MFCGLLCGIAQIILDNTKLTPGHVTSLFVVIGAALDIFGIYDIFKRSGFYLVDLDGDGINDNIHQVRGHYRSTPSGGVTYVDPHIRTNPNAIVSDNISHNR